MSTAAIPVLSPPLQWSHWYPCGPGFRVSHVPEVAGLCVIGSREGSGFRIVHVEAVCNLQQAFRRLFDADSPVYAQLQQGGCLMRYVPIAERRERTEVLALIQKWLAAEAAAAPVSPLVDELLSGEVFQEEQ